MSYQRTYRVFVSYTGKDLSAHADVVAKVLRALQHLAIDHKDSGATGQPSVQWCMEEIDKADFLIVLVAHRYGWIPSKEEGGDGKTSITQLEVKHARATGKTVLPYILEDNVAWVVQHIEGLNNPKIQKYLEDFKSELLQTVAAFFTDPDSLDGPLSRDIPKAIARLKKRERPAAVERQTARATLGISPWIYDPNDPPSLDERMVPGLPKRILSIQGGGFRAAVTVGYLNSIERHLQARYGDASFRLSDYYDLIGAVGSSSLIAIELARGRTVIEAADTYKRVLELGIPYTNKPTIFRFLLGAGLFKPFFSDGPLQRSLEDKFGGLFLRDAGFKTGFALIATDLHSSRPVVISNHPDLVVNFNKSAPLASLAKACLARPGIFRPVIIKDPEGKQHALAEGEASVGSDPGLMLLLLATSPSYPYKWRLGQHRLSMTSVGFARKVTAKSNTDVGGGGPLQLLRPLLEALALGAEYQSRNVLEVLAVDASAGGAGLLEQSAAMTFRRYEVDFGSTWITQQKIEGLEELISGYSYQKNPVDGYEKIGSIAASHQIDPSHFPAAFDVRIPVDVQTSVEKRPKAET